MPLDSSEMLRFEARLAQTHDFYECGCSGSTARSSSQVAQYVHCSVQTSCAPHSGSSCCCLQATCTILTVSGKLFVRSNGCIDVISWCTPAGSRVAGTAGLPASHRCTLNCTEGTVRQCTAIPHTFYCASVCADTAETSAVVSEPTSQIPSAGKLLLFALPTLVLPLADPLMSLIDTICIGSYGTVVELAATGPASLLFASASQLFSAFSATALADISRALSKGDRVEASDAFAKAIRDAAIAGVPLSGRCLCRAASLPPLRLLLLASWDSKCVVNSSRYASDTYASAASGCGLLLEWCRPSRDPEWLASSSVACSQTILTLKASKLG